jgi:hypothetical protein
MHKCRILSGVLKRGATHFLRGSQNALMKIVKVVILRDKYKSALPSGQCFSGEYKRYFIAKKRAGRMLILLHKIKERFSYTTKNPGVRFKLSHK